MENMLIREVVVLGRQTIWDIAIQEYGDVMGVFRLMADNMEKGLTLNSELHAGQLLDIKSGAVSPYIATYYAKRKLKPITERKHVGIGHATIGRDNRVG